MNLEQFFSKFDFQRHYYTPRGKTAQKLRKKQKTYPNIFAQIQIVGLATWKLHYTSIRWWPLKSSGCKLTTSNDIALSSNVESPNWAFKKPQPPELCSKVEILPRPLSQVMWPVESAWEKICAATPSSHKAVERRPGTRIRFEISLASETLEIHRNH